MAKILVTPVSDSGVAPFEVEGKLSFKHTVKKIYYINGESYPEHIVTILEEESK